jgi:hypothetical protein
MTLTLALVIHLISEAGHNSISIYEQTAAAFHERLPFLPWPTFGWWLTGLAVTVLVLFALLPLAFRAGRWMRRAAYLFALWAALNAFAHLTEALRFSATTGGTWSAMLLLVAAALLFVAARRVTPNHHLPFAP